MRTNKLAGKAGWRSSQRIAEGRALQARPKCVSKDASQLSLANLGPTCQSTELRSWLAARQEISTTGKGIKIFILQAGFLGME